MNRFEKRKLKKNIYKHGNTILYVTIFAMASVITIAAANNRTEDIAYIDESKLVEAAKESVEMKNSATRKVAVAETDTEVTTVYVEPSTQVSPETESDSQPMTKMGKKIKIVADTLKVRAEASVDSDMLGMVDMDQVFNVISVQGDWIQINYNGSYGYISAEFAEYIEE